MWTTAIVVACVVFFAHWIVTAISGPIDKKPDHKPRSSGYFNSSQPSASSSPISNNNPKDPNEGYFVTERDARGASERIKYGGLITQRKDAFGNWEDV